MNNPFKLLTLMFRTHRPSRIGVMKAVKEGFWLGKSYDAMMFFGHILTHTQEEADAMNTRTDHMDSIQRHETIHLRQAQACHDSWICYYWLYGWYCLRGLTLRFHMRKLPRNKRLRNAAYRLNPFEMEAYEHMYEKDYLDKCRENGAQGWRTYAHMSPRKRLEHYLSRR